MDKIYCFIGNTTDQEHKIISTYKGLNFVNEVLSSRADQQQLNETKQIKQSSWHIMSLNPFNRLPLDIFALKNMKILIMDMVYI